MAYKKGNYISTKSKEEKKKELDESIKLAKTGIKNAFSSSKKMREGLDYIFQLPKYSLNNIMLLKGQINNDPQMAANPPCVKSYKEWEKEGYQVQKGARALAIFIPNNSRYFENEKGEIIPLSKASPKEKELINRGAINVLETGTTFSLKKCVFHFTNTNLSLEEYHNKFEYHSNLSNPNRIYNKLVELIIENGIGFEEVNLGLKGGQLITYGIDINKRQFININSDLNIEGKIGTLLHEISHLELEHAHSSKSTEQKEIEAEMCAYLLSKDIGLDTSEVSFDYLSNWTKNQTDDKIFEGAMNSVRKNFFSLKEKYIDKVVEKPKERNNKHHDISFER